jgi:hypothetical protein
MELMETTQARSLRTLQVKLIKIGAKVVRHSRYVNFSDGGGAGFKRVVSGNP